MAIGALKALDQLADHFKNPEIRNIPVTGCDGLRDIGQKLVREGKLAATVVIPVTSGPAIERLVRYIEKGEKQPEEVVMDSSSFPDVSSIRAIKPAPLI
jgi:hypothetical protein